MPGRVPVVVHDPRPFTSLEDTVSFRSTRKNRRNRAEIGGVDPDHLARSRFGAVEPLTHIDRPDAVVVRRHAQPLELSTAADWELEVLQWIDEMHARGSLDEGSFYVADELIRTRLAAELQLIDDEMRAALGTDRSLLASTDQGNLQRSTQEVSRLRRRHRELRAQIEVHTARLQGREPLIDPAHLGAAGDDEPITARPLPRALDLNDLLPPPLLPALQVVPEQRT